MNTNLTDLEIAASAKILNITDIAKKIDISSDEIEQYGKDKSYNRCCCIGKERQFNQYNKQGYWKGKHLNDECKQKFPFDSLHIS